MAKALVYNATLQDRIDVTSALTIFHVKPDEPPTTRPWFVPGQYCVLGMNNEANPELGSQRRSMSIASAPEHDGPVEFYVRFVATPASDNPLTHMLWKIKPGDRLYMRPVAAGHFTLPDTIGTDDNRFRVLVAAGTGSAPFVSMVRSELQRNPQADLSRYVLLHGASYANDLGYREELLGLVKSNGLRYFGTVSRPDASPGWTGDAGRVENYFSHDKLGLLEERLGLAAGEFSPKTAAVLICGLQGTIGTTITNLISRGFIPDQRRIREALGVPTELKANLFFEQYDAEPVIDIKTPGAVEPLRALMQTALGLA